MKRTPSVLRASLVLALVPAAVAAVAGDAPDPDAIADELAGSVLAFDRAVDAADLTLGLDAARLRLATGVLVPVELPDGEPTSEWLFVGRGRLTGDPPDEVEAEQLAYFTGSRHVDVTVRSAVLLPGDRWEDSGPAGRPAVEVEAADRDAAERLFREWVDDAEREGFGAGAALIGALAGDPVGRRFAGAWMDSPELGRLFYSVDPGSKEPVGFGAYRLFVRRDFLTERQAKSEARWEKARQERRARGEMPDVWEDEPEPDCGERDELLPPGVDENYIRMAEDGAMPWIRTWMKSPLAGADPEAEPPGFEPEHYAIDVTLEGDELKAHGVARIRLRANAALRVVPLSLTPGMDVCEVTDSAGRSLPFHELATTVLVALAEPSAPGEAKEIDVRFAGHPVRRWLGRRSLRSTIAWHPHAGHLDRATYDVTLRWPKPLELLASGTQVDGGTEGEFRWSRRKVDVPTIGFSFEIDEYDVVEEKQVGHIDLTFGFYRHDTEMTEERRGEIMTAVKASLLFFEAGLGRLPIDHLTVVVSDRAFSQGLLGFVTLTENSLHAVPNVLFDNRGGEEVRLETISHELAHQWWGNQMGWDGYRDQWLSEALATFSSAKFMTTIAVRPDDYLLRSAERRRTLLARRTMAGQPIASVGSVTLGWRLRANFGANAYAAVVYDKGAAVFSTLAERLGREPTWQMLGALAKTVSNRVIRTETFFHAFERMSGRNLDGFVDEFVQGAGVPALFYEYAPRRAGDAGWVVEGSVRQFPPARFRYAAVATGDAWDVVRRFDREPDVQGWEIAVPFQVDTSDDGESSGVRGTMKIRGATTEFSIPVPRRPRRLVLDPNGVVLADSHGVVGGDGLYRLGDHLLRLGRVDEAADTLGRALEAAGQGEDAMQLEVLIRMDLARLHLDRGDPPAARQELHAIDKLLPRDSDFYLGERALLAARLALRGGRYDLAARTINDFIERYSLELAETNAETLLDPDSVTPLRFSRGELLALLAAAESASGKTDADLLVRMADLAGVDMLAFGAR